MKKILAVLLAVMILFSFSSCSKDELNFYNTMKGMASLDAFTFEGKTTVNINKLDLADTNVPEETKKQIETIKDTYNGKDFVYSGAIDSTNNTLSFHMAMPSADGKTTDLDIQAKGQNLYILKDFAAQYGDVSKLPVETIDGKDYISYDMKNIVEEMFAGAERSIRRVSVAPDLPEGKTGAYIDGFFEGFFAAEMDIEDDSEANKQAYSHFGRYDQLSEADAKDFRDGFDAGYSNCFDKSKDKRAQDDKDVAELLKLKPAMLEKASATYFINGFKSIALKGTDGAVTDLFDNFSTDLVKKDGDSKYTLHLGNDEIDKAAKSLTEYLDNNQDKVLKMVTNFLRSLTDEQFIMIGLNPNDRDQYIADIEKETSTSATATAASDTQTNATVVTSAESTDSLLSAFDLGYDLTVEKTGSVSYDTNESFSIKTKQEAVEQVGLDLDLTVSNTLSVNKSSKDNIPSEISGTASDGANIKLLPADANVTECGILYSKSSDLTNATKSAGAKQSDGSYSVSLTGLEKDTTYYYKAYTVDANGNLIYSGEVKNFKTALSTETDPTTTGTGSAETTNPSAVPTAVTTSSNSGANTSPNTGDASSSLFNVLLICGLAGGLTVWGMRSRTKKHF